MGKLKTFSEELNRVFAPKKKYSLKYAKVLERIGEKKRSERVKQCADYMETTKYSDGSERLTHANFCSDPLCPQCSKRKSMKLFNQVSAVVDHLADDYKFVFVTLTVKNCSGSDLRQTCDELQKSFTRFMDRPRIKSTVKGCFRALEVTHDNNEYITYDMYYGSKKRHIKPKSKYYKERGLKIGDKNPNYDSYHPHLHCIFAVDKNYCDKNNPYYISQRELSEIWQKCLKVDYVPIVDIRACKQKLQGNDRIYYKKLSSAVAEVAKYAVKGSDYLCGTDENNEKTIETLLRAIINRKMFAFYGVMRSARAELFPKSSEKCIDISTDDTETFEIDDFGCLVRVSEDVFNTVEPVEKIRYCWSYSEQKYIKIYIPTDNPSKKIDV